LLTHLGANAEVKLGGLRSLKKEAREEGAKKRGGTTTARLEKQGATRNRPQKKKTVAPNPDAHPNGTWHRQNQ